MIVAATKADNPLVLGLNESCVPHVNSLSAATLSALVADAHCYLKAVDEAGQTMGVVIAMAPGAAYKSVNYQWFRNKYQRFLYIDRIMVVDRFRRCGVAQEIYRHLIELARREGLERLCCEVNIEPPNPASRKLHYQLGFESVGTQETEAGAKRVDLLSLSLAEV